MENREEVISTVLRDVERTVGKPLRSLFLYGSALTEEFVEKRSDYNFGLVADPLDRPLLDRLQQVAAGWRERRVPVPVLFSPAFFAQARDSFPLEFLAMKATYRIVAGQDLIARLEIAPEDVRLECEWELRSKLLLLRRVYVGSNGDQEPLHHTIVEAVPALTAILRGCLFFLGRDWDVRGERLWDQVEEALSVPSGLMPALIEERRERKAHSANTTHLYLALLEATERLVEKVDSW